MIKLNIQGFSSSYVALMAKMLSKLTEHTGEINVRLVDSEEVKRLNLEYAGKNEATDVLSFSYLEDKNGKKIAPSTSNSQHPAASLGDIVISQEHVKLQSKAAGTNEETEFLLLLLHGALHILGYDHVAAKRRQEMDTLQRDIMLDLGLPYRDFGWQK